MPRLLRRLPISLVLLGLLALLLAAIAAAAAYGQVAIPPGRVLAMVLARLGLGGGGWAPEEEAILFTLRLPRVVGAAIVGAALATAGALFQGLLRNPLADPYVVGTSGGAALGAVLGMLLGGQASVLGLGIVPAAAFVGALAAMLVVVQVASIGGRLPVVTVLLTGFALSTMLGYTVPLLLVLDDRLQLQLPRVYGWMLGGISVSGWPQLALLGALVLGGILGGIGMARTLNAFSLGEDGAARLGIDVERDKRVVLALGSLLTAAAVTLGGLIGFVGLLVPHVLRLLCGPDHRRLLPAAALGGAAFMVLADLAARSVRPPTEIPVGILTAFLGGPFFLWLLRRTKKEYQW
ncbi:MAG: FecCD family ABC transporter permease [Armatimonadota bacterium]